MNEFQTLLHTALPASIHLLS
ncbi:hypothetical protein CNECB9_2850002 [Cupriavidus necator]|uniref:Uncharacterized protein n=1 Tax=Cupriavidus necator TaxID=106590 RepID=A0A1K0JE14_CUPNE|nr:hypothetical protein CNECB9_2850002 [Cupriavidus necator]